MTLDLKSCFSFSLVWSVEAVYSFLFVASGKPLSVPFLSIRPWHANRDKHWVVGAFAIFQRLVVRPIISYGCQQLPDSYLVYLIDVTLACEDANSKLVDVFTVAD